MQPLKRSFKRVTRDILSLLSGSVLGQLVHFAALPYLAFYFSKDEIGAFFLFQALVSMGGIFVTLQSEKTIVVENNELSYFNFKKSIQIIVFLSLVVGVLTLPAVHFLGMFTTKTSFLRWAYLLAPALILTGCNTALEYLLTFEKQFRLIAFIRFLRPLVIYLIVILMRIIGFQFFNLLILAFMLSNLLLLLYLFFIRSTHALRHFQKADFSRIGFIAFYNRHRKILIFNTTSSGIVNVSMQFPYVILSAFYGESASACYGMAMRIIGMPMGLLGQSSGQVFFQKFSDMHYKHQSIHPVLLRLVRNFYMLGLVPMILLFVCIPEIYHLFLKNNWDTAVTMARWLLPWLFVLLVSVPLSQVIPVLGIQLKTLYYDIALFVFRIGSLLACALFGKDMIFTIAVFAMTGVIFNIFYQGYLLHLSSRFSPTISSSS